MWMQMLMKIIIDIPDDYKEKDFTDTICKAIATGIVLPTEYGDLIDRDKLLRKLSSYDAERLEVIKNGFAKDTSYLGGLHTAWRVITDSEVVVPADKEAEND